ncbi:MAG: ABC transporter ATP-binding protein [Lachnospiraceae bacterium]|nr:ABC transporter ATP-binding protein [Lachnospiraceae bacterium]
MKLFKENESDATDNSVKNTDYTIKTEGLNKTYTVGNEKLNVLKNVNFEVKKGEFVAILGPSGSGKSTLMNIIGCMDVADSGKYYLDGIPIHEQKEKSLNSIRNTKIGFIFQNYHLVPTYTIVQNVIMPLLMRGISYNDAVKMSMDTINMLGLSDRIKHKPHELSGGQKQRVAIARALVGDPSLLLADEPTGALDRESGKEVLKLFNKLNEMGNTIVMITHDHHVAEHAQRIVNIIDGNLTVN